MAFYDDDNKSTRDAQDDAILKANTGATHGSIVEFDEHFTEFFYAYMDYNSTFNDRVEKIQATLTDILKALGGGSGPESGGAAGSPPTPGGGPFGGGGGTSPLDKLTTAITKLDARMAGFGDQFETKTQKFMGLLTSNVSDLVASERKISLSSGAIVGTGLGAGIGTIAPIIGTAIGAGIGGVAGLIVSAISGEEEKGQKVEVINWDDFRFTPEEDTTLGTILGDTLKGGAWLTLPSFMTEGLFGENKDQSFQISNWDGSGIPQLTSQVIHLGTILNEINDAVGGVHVGELDTSKTRDWSIPLLAPLTMTISAIGSAVSMLFGEEKPQELEQVSLLETLNQINEKLGENLPIIIARLGGIEIELIAIRERMDRLNEIILNLKEIGDFVFGVGTWLVKIHDSLQILETYSAQFNAIPECKDLLSNILNAMFDLGTKLTTGEDWSLKLDDLGNIIDAEFTVVDKIGELKDSLVPILEQIAGNTAGGSGGGWKESAEQPLPNHPKGSGKRGAMSRKDAAEAYGNKEFETDEGAGDDFWAGEMQKWEENMDPETGKSHFFDGGDIPGQTGVGENEDEVDVKATKGEFIVNKKAARKNRGILEAINSDHFASGGSIGGNHYMDGGLISIPLIIAAIEPGLTALSVALPPLVPMFTALGPALTAFAAGLYIVNVAVAAVTDGLSILANIIGFIFGAIQNVGTAFVTLPLMMASGIVSAMGAVNEVMGKFAGGDMYGAFASGINTVVGAFGKVGDTMFGWLPIVGGVFGQLTGIVTGAVGAFASFMSTMTPFVSKLNPSIVENFNTQIGNLQATMGTAFTGIVSTMADTFQKMGGALLPAAQELAPLFDDLGELLQSAILPIFKVVVTLVQVLIGPAQQAFGQLRTVVIEVVKSFVLVAAMIARLVGAGDFLARLFGNLSRPDSAGATAAGSTSIGSFEGIAKDIAVAAAQASSGGGSTPRNPTDIMQDILGEISAIRDESIDEIIDRAEEMVINLQEEILARWNQFQIDAEDWFNNIGNTIGPAVTAILDRLWERIQEWIRQQLLRAAPYIPAAEQVGRDIINNPTGFVGEAWDYWTTW